MKYITLQDLIYSGLPKNTIIHVYNMYNKLVVTEQAQYIDERIGKCEIYEIEIRGLNSLRVKIDSTIDANEFKDDDDI